MTRQLKVAFVHPDLGLGGAERWLVDMAVGLAAVNHKVTIYTAHLDASRCFEEVRPGANTAVQVVVAGGFLPRGIFRRAQALCAALRCVYLAFLTVMNPPDVAICDVVSAPVAILRFFGVPVIFYCHFPDKLLAHHFVPQKDASALRKAYRWLVDFVEEYTTGMATAVAVNSKFTQRTFTNTFQRLSKRGLVPTVLYPAVALGDNASAVSMAEANRNPCLVSLNRYEKKKRVELAVLTLAALRDLMLPAEFIAVRLVVAGGYDPRLEENRLCLDQLQHLVEQHHLQGQVEFLKNVSDTERSALLASATALLYTPADEHFGIVPIEAMSRGTPVIACNSGGPCETVVSGGTGFLCNQNPKEFATAAAKLLRDPDLRRQYGVAATERVQLFGRARIVSQLEEMLRLAYPKRSTTRWLGAWAVLLGLALAFCWLVWAALA